MDKDVLRTTAIKEQIWEAVLENAKTRQTFCLKDLAIGLVNARKFIDSIQLIDDKNNDHENKKDKGTVDKTEPPRLSVSIEPPSSNAPRTRD